MGEGARRERCERWEDGRAGQKIKGWERGRGEGGKRNGRMAEVARRGRCVKWEDGRGGDEREVREVGG